MARGEETEQSDQRLALPFTAQSTLASARATLQQCVEPNHTWVSSCFLMMSLRRPASIRGKRTMLRTCLPKSPQQPNASRHRHTKALRRASMAFQARFDTVGVNSYRSHDQPSLRSFFAWSDDDDGLPSLHNKATAFPLRCCSCPSDTILVLLLGRRQVETAVETKLHESRG